MKFSNPDAAKRALRALVVDSQLRKLEELLGPFNIFDVLKSTHNEIRHSNVLAWLLDPKGSHGMQELFLRRWLMRVYYESDEGNANYLDPVEIDTVPFKLVEIRREWKHIDLLVKIVTEKGEQWIVCIENKIQSWQSEKQLEGYRKQVNSAFETARQFFIFLTVREEEPEDAAYVVGTYDQVSSTLKECRDEQGLSLGDGPRMFIDHYLSILQERFMANNEVTDLAQKIYTRHKLALDTIIALRLDNVRKLTDKLKELLESDANALKVVPKSFERGRLRFVPADWDNILKNSGSKRQPIAVCELKFPSGNPLLRVFITANAPNQIGERLCAASLLSMIFRLRSTELRFQSKNTHSTLSVILTLRSKILKRPKISKSTGWLRIFGAG
jgi:hypothetical protein